MQHRTSLPILATLFALLLAMPACDSSAGGSGGDPTGNAGGTGGTGGTGASGGGDPLASCEVRGRSVVACLYPGLPPSGEDNYPPDTFTATATVTALRPISDQDYCASGDAPTYTIARLATTTVIDLVDQDGIELNLGFRVGDIDSNDVSVGDVLEIEASHHAPFDVFAPPKTSLRVSRGGKLLFAAGENNPLGFDVVQAGPSTCTYQRDYCAWEEAPMAVQTGAAETVVIENGASAEIGDLTVLNDRFYEVYDVSGACNFGADIEYVIGAYPTPSP